MQIFFKSLIANSGKVNLVPETIEKFKSVSTEEFIFVDSFNFLSSSLEKLVESTKKEDKDAFTQLRKHYPNDKQFALLLRKGVYFYDYASSFEIFQETSLPSKEDFFNTLNDEDISEKDYKHAEAVFKEFKCKNLLEYMELYVATDTILLADVFEHFRNLAIESYGLDPLHYISLPSFGRDAMLKKTGVEIELISDVEVLNLFKAGIRGGELLSISINCFFLSFQLRNTILIMLFLRSYDYQQALFQGE